MQVISTNTPTLQTLLKLSRASNLPTVWTNVLTGTVLAGGGAQSWRTGMVAIAMSLLYVGGMYLNDYFDRAIDARERPERPIASGDISAATVCSLGFGMLGLGVALMAIADSVSAFVGLLLALLVVGYDAFHKGNPFAPVIMGACRALVYCGAAAVATGSVPPTVMIAGLALLAYVAGLTYAARQESLDRVGSLWPLFVLIAPMLLTLPALRLGLLPAIIYLALIGCAAYAIYLLAARPMPGAVPRAVGLLIAGISLVDAAFLANIDAIVPALVAMLGFPATLLLQKHIAGT